MSVGVLAFPGSNGDTDALYAVRDQLQLPCRLVDYRETDLCEFDALILPGGFSYGDHLRPGAIARFAPVMDSVKDFANRGGPVLGICNGFQILTEAHLLPGALLRNESLQFRCLSVHLTFEAVPTAWTSAISTGAVLSLPVAHGDGMYFGDDILLDDMEEHDQIVARYCDSQGRVTSEANPNGSLRSIASICNRKRNVVGLMPHPERAADADISNQDGLRMLESLLHTVNVPV